MSKAPQEDDKAVLAALDGIVRMQRTIRGGLDVCVDTGLVFVRTYYNNLPEAIARRLTELNPVALAAIPGATSYHRPVLCESTDRLYPDRIIRPITWSRPGGYP